MLLYAVIAAALVGPGVVNGVFRGLEQRPDWSLFRAESLYVWEHGHSASDTTMFGYVPSVPILLWPFTVWAGNVAGCVLWVAFNLLCCLAAIWAVSRWWLPPDRPTDVMLWAVLLCCVNFANAIGANQMSMWILLLLVAGLALVERGRSFVGGALLGAAVVFKTLPAVLGVYLIMRRRWLSLGGMVAAFVLLDLVPCLLVFGFEGTVREHRDWLRRAGWHSNGALITDPLLRVHRHGSNEAFSLTLARWLRATPAVETHVIVRGNAPEPEIAKIRAALGPRESLRFDPMVPRDAPWELARHDLSYVPRFRIANLSAASIRGVWLTTLALGFVMLAAGTWRMKTTMRDAEWAPMAALWILAMLWPSPMMRRYYLVLALPALVVVCQALLVELPRHRERWTLGMRVGSAGIWAWLLGIACLGNFIARWYGVHLFVVAVLMASTAWAWRRGRAHPIDDFRA